MQKEKNKALFKKKTYFRLILHYRAIMILHFSFFGGVETKCFLQAKKFCYSWHNQKIFKNEPNTSFLSVLIDLNN